MRVRHWALLLAMLTVMTRGVEARTKRDANGPSTSGSRPENLGLAVGQARSVMTKAAHTSEGPPAESAESVMLYIVETTKDGEKEARQELKRMLELRAIRYKPFGSFVVSKGPETPEIIDDSSTSRRGCVSGASSG